LEGSIKEDQGRIKGGSREDQGRIEGGGGRFEGGSRGLTRVNSEDQIGILPLGKPEGISGFHEDPGNNCSGRNKNRNFGKIVFLGEEEVVFAGFDNVSELKGILEG
jgi:hypothetical protein